jgi:hypothetical protein
LRRVLTEERGSIAPVVAGYLALILLTILGSAAVGTTMITTNRVQAVADATVLFAHDRSITRGIPEAEKLDDHAREFLSKAPSAKRIVVSSLRVKVSGAISELELCASWVNPIGLVADALGERTICRISRAESFIVR